MRACSRAAAASHALAGHMQVEFCVLPPTPQAMNRSRPADLRELPA
jgi:hypothetical protein